LRFAAAIEIMETALVLAINNVGPEVTQEGD
jgi:hypothetical protein